MISDLGSSPTRGRVFVSTRRPDVTLAVVLQVAPETNMAHHAASDTCRLAKMVVHMSNDPLLQLEAAIALAAQERDKKTQKSRDDQTAKKRRRDQAKAVWVERKKELPAIVETINRMLRGHGFDGLAIGNLDSRHSDVDRLVIDFAHSRHSHTKILLCVTTAGEFTCAVGAAQSDTGQNGLLIEQLSEVRLKEVLAKAVEECLSGKLDQRPPMVFNAAAAL